MMRWRSSKRQESAALNAVRAVGRFKLSTRYASKRTVNRTAENSDSAAAADSSGMQVRALEEGVCGTL